MPRFRSTGACIRYSLDLVDNSYTSIKMGNKADVNYACPICRSYLLVRSNIVLVVKPCTEEKQGILLINPKHGNYELICHHEFDFKRKECFDYFCPSCDSNLSTRDKNQNSARIIMIDKDQTEYDLFFPRHFNEQSKFIVSNVDIVKKYY